MLVMVAPLTAPRACALPLAHGRACERVARGWCGGQSSNGEMSSKATARERWAPRGMCSTIICPGLR